MNTKFLFTIKSIAAIIMLQTLFYKFNGAKESVELFIKLAGDNEAIMRIGTGILELIASVLLFVPKRIWLGAFLTISLMGGAIFSHLTKIGITHNNDRGLLFGSAIFIFITGIIILVSEKDYIPFLKK